MPRDERIEDVRNESLDVRSESKNVFREIDNLMSNIKSQGFSRDLLEHVKNHSRVFIVDIKNDQSLKEYSMGLNESLCEEINRLCSVGFDKEKELPVFDTLKDYALLSRLKNEEIEGRETYNYNLYSDLKNDIREASEKFNNIKSLELNKLNLDLRNSISPSFVKNIINDNREVFIDSKTKDLMSVSVFTRNTDDLREDISLKWDERNEDKISIAKDIVKGFNTPSYITNEIEKMDTKDLLKTYRSLSDEKNYREFVDKVIEKYPEDTKERIIDEIRTNKAERTYFYETGVRHSQNSDILTRIHQVEDKFKDLGVQDERGIYRVYNKFDTTFGGYKNVDKVRAHILLEYEMRNDKANLIDKDKDAIYNASKLFDLSKLDRSLYCANKEYITNGDLLRYDEKSKVFVIDEARGYQKPYKEGIDSIYKLERFNKISRDYEKGLSKEPTERTNQFIDRLLLEKSVVDKIESRPLEVLITKDVAVKTYGSIADVKAQELFEAKRFENNKHVNEIIDNYRNSSDLHENKIALAFDMKEALDKAFLKGSIESMAAEARIALGFSPGEKSLYLNKDGLGVDKLEELTRQNILYRIVNTDYRKNDLAEQLINAKTESDFKAKTGTKEEVSVRRDLAVSRVLESVERTKNALRDEEHGYFYAKSLSDAKETSRVSDLIKPLEEERFEIFKKANTYNPDIMKVDYNTYDLFNSNLFREMYVSDLQNRGLEEKIDEQYIKELVAETIGNYYIHEASLFKGKASFVNYDKITDSYTKLYDGFTSARDNLEELKMRSYVEGRDIYVLRNDGMSNSYTLGLIPEKEAQRLNQLSIALFDDRNNNRIRASILGDTSRNKDDRYGDLSIDKNASMVIESIVRFQNSRSERFDIKNDDIISRYKSVKESVNEDVRNTFLFKDSSLSETKLDDILKDVRPVDINKYINDNLYRLDQKGEELRAAYLDKKEKISDFKLRSIAIKKLNAEKEDIKRELINKPKTPAEIKRQDLMREYNRERMKAVKQAEKISEVEKRQELLLKRNGLKAEDYRLNHKDYERGFDGLKSKIKDNLKYNVKLLTLNEEIRNQLKSYNQEINNLRLVKEEFDKNLTNKKGEISKIDRQIENKRNEVLSVTESEIRSKMLELAVERNNELEESFKLLDKYANEDKNILSNVELGGKMDLSSTIMSIRINNLYDNRKYFFEKNKMLYDRKQDEEKLVREYNEFMKDPSNRSSVFNRERIEENFSIMKDVNSLLDYVKEKDLEYYMDANLVYIDLPDNYNQLVDNQEVIGLDRIDDSFRKMMNYYVLGSSGLERFQSEIQRDIREGMQVEKVDEKIEGWIKLNDYENILNLDIVKNYSKDEMFDELSRISDEYMKYVNEHGDPNEFIGPEDFELNRDVVVPDWFEDANRQMIENMDSQKLYEEYIEGFSMDQSLIDSTNAQVERLQQEEEELRNYKVYKETTPRAEQLKSLFK